MTRVSLACLLAATLAREAGADLPRAAAEAPDPAVEASPPCSGVVLDEVQAGLGADSAGARPGDELLSWSRGTGDGAAAGVFCQWWELQQVQLEQASRGRVLMSAQRGSEALTFELPADLWRVAARPRLPADAVAMLTAARGGDPGAVTRAVARIEQMRARVEIPPSSGLWLASETARLLLRSGRTQEAQRAFADAASAAEQLGVPLALETEGQAWRAADDAPRSLAAFQRQLALQERVEPHGVARVRTLISIAIASALGGQRSEAVEATRRAVALARRLAPETFIERDALNSLGVAQGRRGNFAAAEEAFGRALEVDRKLSPTGGSDLRPALLQNLGIIARQRGDLEAARLFLEEAVQGPAVAADPEWRAQIEETLGNVASDARDLAAARAHYERALELVRGRGAWQQEASLHYNIGRADHNAGHLERAAAAYAEAERVIAQHGGEPEPGLRAQLTCSQGELALARGELARAEELLRAAVRGYRQLEPGLEQAMVLGVQAQLALAKGDEQQAAEQMTEATRVLDQSVQPVGGDAVGAAAFRELAWPIYMRAMELQLDLGRIEEAFLTSERARARGFRELVEERQVELAGEDDRQMETRRRSLLDDLHEAYRELGEAAEGPAAAAARARLELVRVRYRALLEAARREAPRTAALRGEPRLSVEALRQALPAGTVLVSYVMGERSAHVFTLARNRPLRWQSLGLSESELRGLVDGARSWLTRPGRLGKGSRAAALHRVGERVLEPLRDALRNARSLAVVSDGPLNVLPLAVLPSPLHPDRSLVEDLALVYLPDTRALEAPPWRLRPARLLVAADPTLPPSNDRLPALKFAAEEGRAIARLFPGAELLLGQAATERRLLERARSASILHVAAHARVDERFPLDSTVYLTPEGDDDGRLQAWEIFERITLDADLVTLSGCDTALGRSFAGEGLLGLTRAFHVAGARAVLASLWPVDDLSTSRLMQRFYSRLAKGDDPAQALRGAQVSLLRGADLGTSPYEWGAFVLSAGRGLPETRPRRCRPTARTPRRHRPASAGHRVRAHRTGR